MSKAYASVQIALFTLLRSALGVAENVSVHLSAEEWKKLFVLSKGQCVVGVVYTGIKKLPKDQLPPKELLFRWAANAEAIRGMNKLVNQEAARLTKMFDEAGRRTAVLKGPANARLYPDPGYRNCGDIDLWVDGGCESVGNLLYELKLINNLSATRTERHHIHLRKNEHGIETEVHFKPAWGVPIFDAALQKYLGKEIVKAELAPEGFYVPSIKFALVMQLSHLQQHFWEGGVGLRQYADYMVLLLRSTESERKEAADVIKSVYMGNACSAVMWLLGEIFGLERERMLCEPDCRRGKKLMKLAFHGGDLGLYAYKSSNTIKNKIAINLQRLSWLLYDPINAFFAELWYLRRGVAWRMRVLARFLKKKLGRSMR